MANFSNISITNEGAVLIASAATSGTKIEFSHISVGDGVLEEGQDISGMTEMVSPILNLPIESKTNEGTSVLLTANLSTATVEEAFQHRELGVFAGDTMVAYGNAGDDYDAIPSTGSSTALVKKIKVRLNISPGSTSFRDVDSSEFVTYEGLESRINDVIKETAKQEAKTAAEKAAKNAVEENIEDAARNAVQQIAETGEFKGDPGESAYDIWLNAGHEGSPIDFLNWLAEQLLIDQAYVENSHLAQSGIAVKEAITEHAEKEATSNESGHVMIDDNPTSGSSNAVKSGGVYDAIDTHAKKIANINESGHVKSGGMGVSISSAGVASLNVRINHSGFEFDENGAAYLNTGSDLHPTHGQVSPVVTDSQGKLAVLSDGSIVKDSTKTITSGAVYTALQFGDIGNNNFVIGGHAEAKAGMASAMGYEATANFEQSTVSGYAATAKGMQATAFGCAAWAFERGTAIGWYSYAAPYSIALGWAAKNYNESSTLIRLLSSDENGGVVTRILFMAAGSPLSNTYCGGEAGIGFIEDSSTQGIIRRGTRKLSELLTDNTDSFEIIETAPATTEASA